MGGSELPKSGSSSTSYTGGYTWRRWWRDVRTAIRRHPNSPGISSDAPYSIITGLGQPFTKGLLNAKPVLGPHEPYEMYRKRQLERIAREFIETEYLQNPNSDSEIYSANDMICAFMAGYETPESY